MLHRRVKSAAISKQTNFFRQSCRSYIVLSLVSDHFCRVCILLSNLLSWAGKFGSKFQIYTFHDRVKKRLEIRRVACLNTKEIIWPSALCWYFQKLISTNALCGQFHQILHFLPFKTIGKVGLKKRIQNEFCIKSRTCTVLLDSWT